nr:glycosyltransferase family 4 protein [Cellulomonas sp. Root485]
MYSPRQERTNWSICTLSREPGSTDSGQVRATRLGRWGHGCDRASGYRVHVRPVVIAQSTTIGGAEKYLTSLYSTLSATFGYEPRLVGHVPGWIDSGFPEDDIGLSPKWGRRTIVGGLTQLPHERDAVRRAISRRPIDYSHLQFKREQLGLTGPVSRYAPVVWTEHGVLPGAAAAFPLLRGYARAARRVGGIICVSELVAGSVRRVVGARTRVEVVENGVDTAKLRPATEAERRSARSELGLQRDAPVLLWVGRMAPSKRPQKALAIGRRFAGQTVLVGGGPMLDEVRSAAGPSVRAVGHVDDVSTYLRAASVLLFTSTGAGEGLPTVILEAAACGLPVIADESSGFGGLVESIGGASLSADVDAQHWASAALALVPQDGLTPGREWAVNHSLDRWAAQTDEVVRDLIHA